MAKDSNAILEHFLYVLPYLNEICISDVGVALTDREKYLLYKAGKKLAFKGEANSLIKPGSAVEKAIAEKRRVVMRGDKAIFGIPYIASAFPVMDDDGEVIGCAVTTESVELQDNMLHMATTLNEDVSVLASTIQEISAQTQEIASVCSSLAQSVLESRQRVKETDQVIAMIRNIAGSINLLGLNAAIEAARVGDVGRGFGVVAGEIRKLSASSTDSIKKIDEVITAIQADSDRNYSQIAQVNDTVIQVAAAITQVAGALQRASGVVQELNAIAESISKDE
jgi:hypothetical protein